MTITNVVAMTQRRRETFVRKIKAAMSKSVAGFIEVGKELIEAKETLEHGEFGTMIEEDLGMSRVTVAKLIAIANHPVISNVTHVLHLPPSWGTLYQLTRVSERTLRARISDGTINPQMMRSEATALIPRPRAAPSPRPRSTPTPIIEDDDDTPGDSAQDIWHRGLSHRASESAAMAHFVPSQWEEFEPDRSVVVLAREAADKWKKLADYLEEKLNA